ncbi:MAG: phosphate signaling complex protein PhoU [Mariprofundaceae bacterium]|nr:phosphate signaling complex protein PhoU [Mariprofundaceae bacterium]
MSDIKHTVKSFEDDLIELKSKVLQMGELVRKATRRSMNSLIKNDPDRAHRVIERDSSINALEVEIDNLTRDIIALRQPAASDLRFVLSIAKIVTDLERMGDLAENIAICMLKTEEHPVIELESLRTLSAKVMNQISVSIKAFDENDAELALRCIANDRKIDARYKSIQREYITYMLEDPRQITGGLIATDIAKFLERIADHAVNISEMVIYMVKGHDVRHIDRKTAEALISGEMPEEDDDE